MSLADEILASDAYKHIRIFVPEPRPTEPRLSLPSLFPAELSVENPWEPNLEDTVIRSRMENLLTRTSPSYASADEVGRNMSGEANTKHRVPPEPLFSVYIQHPPMFKQSKPLSSHHETRQALSNNETYFSDTEPKLNDSRIAKTIVQLPRNRVLLPFVPDSPPTTVSIRWGNKIISNPWEPGISDGAVRRRMETLLATLNTFRESQIPFLPKFSKCTLSRRANPTCWAPATSNFVEELLQLDEFQVVRPHIPNPRPEGQKFQFLLTSQLNPWEVGISEFNAETRIERLKKALLRLGPQKPSSMDGEVSNPVAETQVDLLHKLLDAPGYRPLKKYLPAPRPSARNFMFLGNMHLNPWQPGIRRSTAQQRLGLLKNALLRFEAEGSSLLVSQPLAGTGSSQGVAVFSPSPASSIPSNASSPELACLAEEILARDAYACLRPFIPKSRPSGSHIRILDVEAVNPWTAGTHQQVASRMGRLKHLLKLKHPTLIEGGPMTTMESQGTVSSHHRRSTIVTLAGDGSDKEGDIELKHERFAALGSGLEVPHNSGGGQSSRLGAPTPSVRSNKRPAPIDESTCEKSRDTKKLRLIAPEVLDVPASKSLSDGKQYSGRCGDTVIHNFTSTSSVPTSTSVPTSGCRSPNALLDILLPTSRSPGPNVAIADFCRQYELSDQLCKKLTEQGFARARALRFLTDSELVKHGFSFGERASLRDAIESWSEANI